MKKTIKVIIGVIIVLIIVSALFCLFKLAYSVIGKANDLKPMTYTDFLVIEDNMTPTYNINDLIISKRLFSYSVGDNVLYEGKAGLRLGQISDIDGGYYIIKDNKNEPNYNNKINPDNISGKIVFKIKKFAHIYSIITSPFFLIGAILLVSCYSVFMPKEKSVM